jgi:hypothetical protein
VPSGVSIRPKPPELKDKFVAKKRLLLHGDVGWLCGTITKAEAYLDPRPNRGQPHRHRRLLEVKYEGSARKFRQELSLNGYCSSTVALAAGTPGSWCMYDISST